MPPYRTIEDERREQINLERQQAHSWEVYAARRRQELQDDSARWATRHHRYEEKLLREREAECREEEEELIREQKAEIRRLDRKVEKLEARVERGRSRDRHRAYRESAREEERKYKERKQKESHQEKKELEREERSGCNKMMAIVADDLIVLTTLEGPKFRTISEVMEPNLLALVHVVEATVTAGGRL